jgi:hypothetical protein
LRKYRPFTPAFIGRAEDQAYILSVLFKDQAMNLRYVHKDSLIMRHDKKSFAQQAIETASTGKIIGDYIRTLWFSHYAKILPWSFDKIKDEIDPFTGCFASRIPITVVHLRLALKAALFFEEGEDEKGVELLKLAVERLPKVISRVSSQSNQVLTRFKLEQKAWDIYYDTLDLLEKGIQQEDPFALKIRDTAKKLFEDCLLKF